MTSYLFFVIITLIIEIIIVGGKMERIVISQDTTQCIYLLKDTNLDFYLVIPNSRQVSIVLGIFPDVTESIVKSLPKQTDKVIVIPIINNQILTSANHLDNVSFKYLDNVFSYLINVSYKMLTHNKIVVNNKILINNHSLYENFNNKYIEKYQGRVELFNLIDKSIPTEVPTSNQNIFEPISATTTIPAFTPKDPPFKDQISKSNDNLEEEIDPILYDEPVITSPDKEGKKDPGFISYVLLGVLVAVISLIFLYMIL